MAEVITAKTAGFCFGVKRAVDKAYELAGNGEGIYSFGPVIHNDEVVGDLESSGRYVLPSSSTAVNSIMALSPLVSSIR